MARTFTGRAVPGSRHFDSLGMALRAFELARVWREGRFLHGYGMPVERIERTERAAFYLHQRVMRGAKLLHW